MSSIEKYHRSQFSPAREVFNQYDLNKGEQQHTYVRHLQAFYFEDNRSKEFTQTTYITRNKETTFGYKAIQYSFN